MKREVYTISVRDKAVAGWSGQGADPVDGVFTRAIVNGVSIVSDENQAMFFVSRGVAETVADFVGGEINTYQKM